MVIRFFLRYTTQYGQNLHIRLHGLKDASGNDSTDIPMEYLDKEYWIAEINTDEFKFKDLLEYHYFITEKDKDILTDLCSKRKVELKKIKLEQLDVFDEWQIIPLFEKLFLTKPFEAVFNNNFDKGSKKEKNKKFTHKFKIFTRQLQKNKCLCITGSAKEMTEWSEESPVLMQQSKDCWTVGLDLRKAQFPISFKLGIYDTDEKKLVYYEEGNNRLIQIPVAKDAAVIYHLYPVFDQFRWKAAGLNISVSALKSEQSWGVGDFTDLFLLTDLAKKTGISMLQLLPVNDTTATHTSKDSYPYASISAFALHPMYLNVHKLSMAASINFSDEFMERVAALNGLPEINYQAVVEIKTAAIRDLYFKDRFSFRDDFAFFEFFDMNRSWLVPYAAFSFLREKYKSPDFYKWGEYQHYSEDAIQELASPENDHYDEIAIHYFTQYHLHLQLLDAVEYAHKNGIILKGDLPIGVGHYSVDTWMYPHIFHMDMQAGAPPDAFAVKGQNWEFPTYNWDEMEKDNYAWWRQRMEHMSNYFDAIRIDHILGFFRIWSIPKENVEGILGVFSPSIALHKEDFEKEGIDFDEDRFCKPFITDEIISNKFPGEELWVKEHVLVKGTFKKSLNTQQKLAVWFTDNPAKKVLLQELNNLIADVILIKDRNEKDKYHFRINNQETTSFKHLDQHIQQKMNRLYNRYFYELQDTLWKDTSEKKLDALQLNTKMLICAEDLGMVPDFVEQILLNREILSLQVQRMPKKMGEVFAHPQDAAYVSVVTPSTHDMSTIREFWEVERENIQYLYNNVMGLNGTAPSHADLDLCREIIKGHLESPAMWAIFLLQDLMSVDDQIRRKNPGEERINIPADPNHIWDYRMHITLEMLLHQQSFTDTLFYMIKQSGRA